MYYDNYLMYYDKSVFDYHMCQFSFIKTWLVSLPNFLFFFYLSFFFFCFCSWFLSFLLRPYCDYKYISCFFLDFYVTTFIVYPHFLLCIGSLLFIDIIIIINAFLLLENFYIRSTIVLSPFSFPCLCHICG